VVPARRPGEWASALWIVHPQPAILRLGAVSEKLPYRANGQMPLVLWGFHTFVIPAEARIQGVEGNDAGFPPPRE